MALRQSFKSAQDTLPPEVPSPLSVVKKTNAPALSKRQTAALAKLYKKQPVEYVARATMRAAMEDDINTLNAIALHHPACASLFDAIDIGAADGEKLMTPAIYGAVMQNSLRALAWLIEHGADVNARSTWDNETPLHVAVRLRRPEVAKILLAAHANPYAVDAKGVSVYQCAWEAFDQTLIDLINQAQQSGYVLRARPVTVGKKAP